MSIQIKRGMKKDLPQLKDGELAFCRDTKELYVGNNGNENVNVTDKSSEIINGFDNKIKEIETTLSSNIEQTEINKEYIESKKSVIQRAIDFVDNFRFECSFGDSSFVKMPDVLGGLIIQWGSFNPSVSEIGGGAMYPFYPRAFATNHHTIVGTINASDENTNVREVIGYIRKAEKEKFRYRLANGSSSPTSNIQQIDINWIAIGK